MAWRVLSPPLSSSQSKLSTAAAAAATAATTTTTLFYCCSRLGSRPSSVLRWRPRTLVVLRRRSTAATPRACVKLEDKKVTEMGSEWGKVSAVLFDMDGVLCNSEEPSRRAAVDVFAEMGVEVTVEDFVPFMGTGEAKFLGEVASAKGVEGFNTEAAKKSFFEIYLDK